MDTITLNMNRIGEPGRSYGGETKGVIYLGWKGGASAAELWHARWKELAERLYEELRGGAAAVVGRQWLHTDLFLIVRLPSPESGDGEDWLLDSARSIREEWERRFLSAREELVRLSSEGRGGRRSNGEPPILHAGVSVIGRLAEDDLVHDEWYDAMKRAIIHGQRPGSVERSLKRRAFERIIERRTIHPVYQPIVSLADGGCFGYEALTRIFGSEWFDGPLSLFKFADEEGAVYALDRLAREKAIEYCRKLTERQKIFINITAHIMDDPHFTPGRTLRLLERRGLSPRNVVFELTERSSIEDFAAAKKVLDHYRSQGYEIAIDDVGAGYSSLQSIVELRPDYIKVDRSLVQHIHLDEMKEHIMSTFVQFARRMDIAVIAEGIELEEELTKVKSMGVHYAQGYLLGRPVRHD